MPSGRESRRTLRVGLLGCGTVGSEVARVLQGAGLFVPRGVETAFVLSRVAVRDPDKQRDVEVPASLLTNDALSVVKDPSIDVIVELIGGVDLPFELLRQAIAEGKSVVTANKALIAAHGEELHRAAADRGVALLYEGSVGGALPIVRAMKESLAGDRILRFAGVLNGTTNFVLDRVTEGHSFEEAVAQARALGYAEADPSIDLSGRDSAEKAAVLTRLAFGVDITAQDVFTEGIDVLTEADVELGVGLGYATKLVAYAERYASVVDVRVEPQLVPLEDPLARGGGATNVVVIDSELAGRLIFEGAGAGGRETAGAVLGDLAELGLPRRNNRTTSDGREGRVLDARPSPGRFLVRCPVEGFEVQDRAIGNLFSFGVGVNEVHRIEAGARRELVFVTDTADASCVRRALDGFGSGEGGCSILKLGGSAIASESVAVQQGCPSPAELAP